MFSRESDFMSGCGTVVPRSERVPLVPDSVTGPGHLPSDIERHVFTETRLTAYRLKKAA
jgi:hypothetical protein